MTTTYAALLRGVNVGKRKVPSADLRELLTGLGYTGVRTYLASGNAVFATDAKRDPDALAAEIAEALEKKFGFEVPTLVRTHDYLQAVIDACPYPADELEGKQLHAIFYSVQVDDDRFADFDLAAYQPEEFRLGDRVMYLYVPNGLGRSPLAEALAKRKSRMKGVLETARNWNTVKALAEMTGE